MKTKGKLYLSTAVTSIPAGKPVLFFDTCSMLEILRLSERSNNPGADFDQYVYIAERISSGDLIAVTSELVFQEFNQHYTEELKKLRKLEKNNREAIKRITAIMAVGSKRTRIENSVDEMHTETRITSTVSKIWRNTILIREEKRFLQFAYTRIKHKMAPSQNKEQFKDSYIWGTFLNLAHRLPAYPKMFFFTLNKKDYLDPNNGGLCTQIDADLNVLPNVELHYVLGSLYGELNHMFP